MTCWSCGLPLPPGARFCARCGVRQRLSGLGAPAWVVMAFTGGACVAALLVLLYGVALLTPAAFSHDPQLAQFETVAAWAVMVYATILLALQLGAVAGLARAREWGRVLGTLACLLWCLTGVGLLISAPVLYYLWRPARVRR